MKERNKPAYSALRRMLLHWGSILFFALLNRLPNASFTAVQRL